MSENKKTVRGQSTRRTLEQRLNDALAKKPTNHFLAQRGITPEQLKTTLGMKPVLSHDRRANIIRQTASRPRRMMKPVAVLDGNILVTGGIGDLMAVESFMPDAMRHQLHTISYATRARRGIETFFRSLPNFPNLKSHNVIWDDFSKTFAFHNKQECDGYIKKHHRITPPGWNNIADWSIAVVFSKINTGKLHYTGSSLVKFSIADLTTFSLPKYFFTICPYSINDKRIATRDFDDSDWERVIDFLEKKDVPGIVLNTGHDAVPEHPLILDYSNRTSLPEAVEILKVSQGYFGIDSCLSVLAAKVFSPPYLAVKSQNGHLYNCRHIYYAPKTNFDFVKGRLEING